MFLIVVMPGRLVQVQFWILLGDHQLDAYLCYTDAPTREEARLAALTRTLVFAKGKLPIFQYNVEEESS